MADKPPKRPRDPNQLAKAVIDLATGQTEETLAAKAPERVRSGAKGGLTRANRMTEDQRAEAARLAAQARWRRKED